MHRSRKKLEVKELEPLVEQPAVEVRFVEEPPNDNDVSPLSTDDSTNLGFDTRNAVSGDNTFAGSISTTSLPQLSSGGEFQNNSVSTLTGSGTTKKNDETQASAPSNPERRSW
jgi:hypothetical protein